MILSSDVELNVSKNGILKSKKVSFVLFLERKTT